MNSVTWVQIVDEVFAFSQSAKTPGKWLNPTIYSTSSYG